MSLVSDVLRAHGGRRRWNRLTGFSAHVSIGGALLAPRQADQAAGRGQSWEFAIEGETARPNLKLFWSDDPDRFAIYRPDQTEIRSRSGSLIAAAGHPIPALTSADPVPLMGEPERLFLIGNALWSAIAGPFAALLPGAAAVTAGEGLLEINLPPETDPLRPLRRMHVGEDGIAHRCDYRMRSLHAGILADTLSAHASFDGILIATLRRLRDAKASGELGTGSLLDIEVFDVRFQ